MKFSDLRKMTLTDFMAQSPGKDAFWFFLHIPKTAGSSFSTELAATVAPYHNIGVDYTRTDIPFRDRLSASVGDFLSRPDLEAFRSASGHVPYNLARRLNGKIPAMQMVTILRAPVDRVVSDYRYQRTELHPPHEAFKAKYPTLESFVEDPVSQNNMAKFVAHRDASAEEALMHLEQEFAFVGLLEMYPLSFSVIFDLMGHPGKTPVEHQRKTPENKDTEVDLTPALARRIRELNSVDQYLFEKVRETLVPHRDEWLERLSESRSQSAGGSNVTA